MKKNNLIKQLKIFIEPHPVFVGSEEDIFTPKRGFGIKFWFEGGFEVEAQHSEIEINFNAIKIGILVLALRTSPERIIRIPIERIIAFELLPNKNIEPELSNLLRLGKEQNN